MLLAKDEDGNALPVAGYGVAHRVSISATSARNTSAFGEKIITVTVTKASTFKRGKTDTVEATATDHYLAPGIPYDIALGDSKNEPLYPYLAILSLDGAGFAYISERK